jgi:hypothetical protein
MRTVDAYTRTLRRFFGTAGKTPEQVSSPDVFGFTHGIGPSGEEPAAITIGARLACISSFYRFLIRMEIVARHVRPVGNGQRSLRRSPPALHGCGHWHPATGQQCSVTRTTLRRTPQIRSVPGRRLQAVR